MDLRVILVLGTIVIELQEVEHWEIRQPVLNEENSFALAHNGNLPSVKTLENFLSSVSMLKNNRSDSELIADAISYYLKQGLSLPDGVVKVYPLLTGAFALTMMDKDTLVAVRDSYGMRPLSFGN